MLLTPDVPSTASRLTRSDSVFVLVLALTMVLAASSFFVPFALPAVAVGVLFSVLLHRHPDVHPGGPGLPTSPDWLTPINFAAVHVGGDAGGLIFVVGSLAIVMLGLPSVRWFLLASVAAATILAVARIAWTNHK